MNPSFLNMRHFIWLLIAILIIAVLALQYQLWFGAGGVLAVSDLEAQIQAELKLNAEASKRNTLLQRQIYGLQAGDEGAIEAIARNDLGMIKKGEKYYEIVM